MQIAEIIYSILLTSALLLAIWKLHWFNLSGISKKWVAAAFLIKVFAGIAMWGIYSFYYSDRNEADIFKYFDDSQVMYEAVHENPKDYLNMMFV